MGILVIKWSRWKNVQRVAVLWAETPRWWERSKENGQTSFSWLKQPLFTIVVSRKASQKEQHFKPPRWTGYTSGRTHWEITPVSWKQPTNKHAAVQFNKMTCFFYHSDVWSSVSCILQCIICHTPWFRDQLATWMVAGEWESDPFQALIVMCRM